MRHHTILLAFASVILAFSCASTSPPKQSLMTSPEVFSGDNTNPFADNQGRRQSGSQGILYATARMPAPEGSAIPYLNDRDTLLHLGSANISINGKEFEWDDLPSLNRSIANNEKVELQVVTVENFGPLDDALHDLVDPARLPEDFSAASRNFADEVNSRLSGNPVKDIFVYIHGVNTTFDDPLFVSAEFWHYSGYRGVPIAFSWPSGQNILKYVSDVDSAEYSATLFRHFLQFLRRETDAEEIHIIAYSAGTKLASQALYQIALIEDIGGENDDMADIGRVHFVAGDIERQLFGLYAADGLLNPLKSLTVYMSSTDQALKFSESIRVYPRLGQTWKDENAYQYAADFINNTKLEFIDVTGLEGSTKVSGHGYFRSSPWVSSDIIASMLIGLEPDKRGLVLSEGVSYWTFPEDYIPRLRQAIWELNLINK